MCSKMIVLVIILLISANGFAGDTGFYLATAGLAGATAADIVSGARLDDAKFHEVNVMGQSTVAQALVASGTSAGAWYGSRYLYKHGKKKTAILLMIGVAAAHGAAAAHNWRLK